MSKRNVAAIVVLCLWCVLFGRPIVAGDEATGIKPRVIPLDFRIEEEGRGSVVAADLNGDGIVDQVDQNIVEANLGPEKLWP